MNKLQSSAEAEPELAAKSGDGPHVVDADY